MQITVNADVLKDSLNKMLTVVDKKISRPLLTNCLIKAEKDNLIFTATDLEVSAKVISPATIDQEGVFCINIKNIFDIVRELPSSNVTIVAQEEKNLLRLTCENINYSLVITNADDYPVIKFEYSNNQFVLPARQVTEAIAKVSHAISNDETRPFLNGMFMQVINSNLRAVAVDGYRLALLEMENFEGPEDILTDGIIIPRKGVSEIKKMAETYLDANITFAVDESFIYVRVEDKYFLAIRLIAREFPKYQAHIPSKTKFGMTVDRNSFINAIKRIRILANEKTNGVKLSINENQMIISANNTIIGDAVEKLDINYKGDPIEIGFNAKYLMDTLNVLPDSDVTFEFNNELNPVLVKADDLPQFLGILMPLKL